MNNNITVRNIRERKKLKKKEKTAERLVGAVVNRIGNNNYNKK